MRRPIATLVVAAAALSLSVGTASASPTSPAQPAAPSSAAPSSSVAPAATPKILKARYGTFPSKTYRGKGTMIVKLPQDATRGLVTINARGKGQLKVQLLNKKRKPMGRALVAKRTAPYQGTTLFGLSAKDYDPTFLKIESSSKKKWTVKVEPLHKAPALKKKQRGSGDAVFRYTLTKSKRWSFNYRAAIKRKAVVTTYGLTRSQVLFNKATKRFTGKLRVDDFTGFVEVRSHGTWTLKR